MRWLVLLLWGLAAPAAATDDATVKLWADAIADAVDKTVRDVMQVPVMQEIINEQPYTEISIDGTVQAASAAALVSRLFDEKTTELALLADAALAAFEARDGLTGDGGAPATAAVTEQEWPAMPYSGNVSMTYSTYVLPAVDAAEAESQVFSAELDPTFISNGEADSELVFQYFGAAEDGVLRSYPGMWQEDDGLSDARLSAWYSLAVAGPRNLVLLVDASSSESKSALILQAAQSILSTVSLDDYVMFAAVSGGSVTPLACFSGEVLVRGTADNVAAFGDALAADDFFSWSNTKDDLRKAAKWGSDLAVASAAAAASVADNCETVVVIVSGSEVSDEDDLLEAGDVADSVRVMTFNVGGGSSDEWLRLAACAGAGVYQALPSWDDAFSAGRLLYSLLSNPSVGVTYAYGGGLRPDLALLGEEGTAQSLLTVAQAVWSDAGELVGVVALDFEMFGIKDTLDSLKFQQSFPFLVNGAGDTLYHPLQTEYKELELYDVGRDISFYEYFDGWAEEIRPGLVGGGIGSGELVVERALEKGDTAFEGLDVETIDTTYFWEPIPGVPWLFLGFAYASDDLHQRVKEPLWDPDEEEPYQMFRAPLMYLEPELAALIPNEWREDQDPQLAELLGQAVVYNIDNCPSAETGEWFGNCMADAYCPDCNGTCVCEPHRWPVGTVTAWPASHYAPQCYLDPTVATEQDIDLEVVLDTHSFMNRLANSSNPSPIISEACLLSMEINAKFFPYVKNATAHGLHESTVWTYFGQSTGAIGIFPGSSWGNAYDPTRRPWYSRALAYKGQFQHVISTPYIDAGGAGLMNTFAEAAWEEQDLETGDIVNDRVFGVHGWDMLYPDFNSYSTVTTAHLDGGCSNSTVDQARASDYAPMCFLIDPAGLLLSHSDFLTATEEDAVSSVFLGLKEGPVAQALVDAGFLVARTDVLSETGEELLNYYETEASAIPSETGVLSGTAAIDSPDCLVAGATWHVAAVEKSNIYLLVVNGYERVDDYASQCPTLQLEGSVPVVFDTCAFSDAATDRAQAQIDCPLYEAPSSVDLEPMRASYAKCQEELYIRADSAPGSWMLVLTLCCLFLVLVLSGALTYHRRAYVVLASSPVFCLLICLGAALGLAFVLLLIGRPSRAICHSRIWVAGIAFVTIFAPLVAKTYRIHRIFNNTSFKKVKITNADLWRMLSAVMSVQLIILVLWSAVADPRPTYTQSEDDPLAVNVGCGGDGFGAFVIVNCVFALATVCAAVYLSYQTRNTESEFNESSSIAAAIYTFFFIGVIAVPMTYMLDVNYEAEFVILALGVLLTVMVCLGVLFVPKLAVVNKSKKDFDSDRSTHSEGRTSERSARH